MSSARAELIGLFGLVDCTYEAGTGHGTLPRLGIHGAIEGAPLVAGHSDFLLPPGGVEIAVVGRGTDFGRLVLFASESGAGVAAEACRRDRDRRPTRHHARDRHGRLSGSIRPER